MIVNSHDKPKTKYFPKCCTKKKERKEATDLIDVQPLPFFSNVPRPAFEILNTGTFRLILLNLTIKYKSLVINEIKKSYIYSD